MVRNGLVAIGIAGLCGLATGADRTIDGRGNSTDDRGAAGEPFSRIAPVAYADGTDSPVAGRPNPREISNAVCSQSGSVPNSRGGSDFMWQWGQFIDHDITLAELEAEESHNIPILDTNDPLYSPEFPFIPLNRTEHEAGLGGVRQQVNRITSFIDGSVIYGSDEARAMMLREGSGGRMRIETDGCLPFNTGGAANASIGLVPDDELRVSGDVRCNEQPGLLGLHTIFVREHNRIADALVAVYPTWSDEQVYQRTRKLVGAMIQAITYHEWLPALLGPEAPDVRAFIYDAGADPSVMNEFSTGLFRLGHTLVTSKLMRVDDGGAAASTPWVTLRGAYFNPTDMTSTPESIEMVMKGMACQLHQNADPLIVDDLRNFLFGAPGSGGMDLAALNIQRGRDHGLPDYNTVRAAFGLPAVMSISEVCSDAAMVAAIEATYKADEFSPFDISLVDPWIGALAEDHAAGAAVGPLLAKSCAMQFERMAVGDAFFFLWDDDLIEAEREALAATRLGDVIARNTSMLSLQENVFFVPVPESFAIDSMVRDVGGMVTLNFMAEPGHDYQVMYSDDMEAWHDDLAGGQMDSGDSVLMMNCLDPDATGSGRRFYKVVRVAK